MATAPVRLVRCSSIVSNVMKITPLGDGVMTMTFTLSAKQFANWQSKYGQDQGLLRRDMNNNYTGQFETSDWDVKIDTMNRTITVSVKTRGAVIPRGGGVFEFRVPKLWRGGERNGTTYSYNFVEPVGGGTVAQSRPHRPLVGERARGRRPGRDDDREVTRRVTGADLGDGVHRGAARIPDPQPVHPACRPSAVRTWRVRSRSRSSP